MKKILLFIVLIIFTTGCSNNLSRDVFQYYEYQNGEISWSGIKLGVDTIGIAKNKLLKGNHVNSSSVKEYEYYGEGSVGIIFGIRNQFYKIAANEIRVVESSNKEIIAACICFDGSIDAEYVFEAIATPEKVLILVGRHGLDGRRIVLFNREFGYILRGMDIECDYNNLSYSFDPKEKFVLNIVSPTYFDLFLKMASDGYSSEEIPEEYFQDWKGYIEYDVYSP